ncbi:MAG TPA: hypothetical protein PLG05_09010 [Bacteroidales bacterium]|nr:hypothetical protein [Bacteroidales bacterium]
MDTDDLSREAYEGVIIEAEKFTHDLTIHYGVLAGYCEDETEYLEKAEQLTKEILQLDDWELDDFFWGEPPDKDELIITCKKILENIEKVKAIPLDEREYDIF